MEQCLYHQSPKPMKILLALLALTAVASCFKLEELTAPKLESQYVPVSKTYPGLIIGNLSAPITIELFTDPACGSCAKFEPTVEKLQSELTPAEQAKIVWKYPIMVLPHHKNCFKVAQAIYYTWKQLGSEKALALTRYFLKNIDEWGEKANDNLSVNQLMNNMAKAVSEQTGLSVESVRKEIAHYSDSDGPTRAWTKYGMGMHVGETPQMFVNGARLDDAVTKTPEELATFIRTLL